MADSQYSTLEVSSRHYQNGDQGLEVHNAHGPGPWNSEDKYLQPTTVPYHPLKEYSHELPNSPQYNRDSPAPGPEQKRRICGFSHRVFIAGVVIAVLVVIGAIAGGVAGGLLSREGGSSTDAERSILAISNIAAANRTVKGAEQRTIFFQDGTGALLARHILAPSTEWETTNLTERFESSSTKIRIARGAPMAAVSCADWGCGDTRLFYLRTDGMIGNAKDDGDLGGALWHPPIGNVLDAKLRPSPGAQLAATLTKHYKEEDGGPENIGLNRLLAYQGLDGFIYVANDSAYDRPVRLESDVVDPTDNTSLAMVTQLRENMLDQVSLVTNGTGQASSDLAMREAKFPNDDDEWYQGAQTLATIPESSTDTPSSATTAQLAVMMRNNWRDSVYLALLSGGTLTGRISGHGPDEVTIERFELAGSEDELPRFSAIATTMNGYLYGIVDDTIREYTFDTSDPSILHFEAVVYDESIRERDSAGEDG